MLIRNESNVIVYEKNVLYIHNVHTMSYEVTWPSYETKRS